MRVFSLRLKPEEDLRQSLKAFAIAHNLQAGFILSGIGSLTQAKLRFANQPESTLLTGKFEILSLNGTVSIHGIHLHAAIADANGTVIGGHIDQGCIIYTTAEIIIGEIETITFLRTLDPKTGFLELEIRERSSQND
jgi:predicted DNA-binding protein with PD1-like motif